MYIPGTTSSSTLVLSKPLYSSVLAAHLDLHVKAVSTRGAGTAPAVLRARIANRQLVEDPNYTTHQNTRHRAAERYATFLTRPSNDKLGDHPRQPGTFGCHNSTLSRKPDGTHSRPVAGSGAKDAELRDRSAPDVCSIATLRGPLL